MGKSSISSRVVRLCAVGSVGVMLAGCGSSMTPKVALTSGTESVVATSSDVVNLSSLPVFTSNAATSGAESFSVASYGVAASPRVASGTRIQRGGGRQMVGRPYTVRGRRYFPSANQPSEQHGRASWYGQAFHGRKTANGEVYDMNHLTAAHKTMPLPSYARVTNRANGRSVVVRVNDRGPFSNNRVIDLSKRAAYMLDYISAGTAEVKVEYLGPAPLHGQDDEFLIASFRGAPTMGTPRGGGGNRDLPGVRQPGVMVASGTQQPAPERFGGSAAPTLEAPGSLLRRSTRPVIGLDASAYADARVSAAFAAPWAAAPGAGWKSH
ncbi:MAG: septal ring lytic transglycosylase RlpA family protein [Roseitalea sp.]|nr:septal ring lytic transglycosylase RlpA family protein [Roseitalea sp.]MBO6722365.1 septal ring lytic transglycosylase RlpA family protein [Roseitalea sp.]MBO6744368.1 septal ring lytic transglycosylase RlpA family protein [Roseitalea sp.]